MATSEIRVGWQDYLAIAARRRTFFLVPLALALVVGLLVMIFAPRIYEAQALIAVRSEKLINPLIQGLAMPSQVGDRLQTLREEILSWTNLNKLITKHRLDSRLSKNDKIGYEKLVMQLRKDINVRMKGETLIQVVYEGREPAKVQELVNSLTDIVIERNTTIQKEESDSAVGFIEAELNVYRSKLEESDKNLRQFKEIYMTQMPVATALNSQLKDLEILLSNLLVDNTGEHPRVIEVKRKIQEVRKQRDEEIRRLVAKGVITSSDPAEQEAILNEITSAVASGMESPQVAPLAGPTVSVSTGSAEPIQATDAAATLTLAPRQQQELSRLTRDHSVNESIYKGLLEKLEKAKITGRLGEDDEGGKFTIIERARFPLQPIKPQPLQTLILALCAGIALGILAVMIAEYLDQSLQTSEEAVELLEVPVLGTISTIVTAGDIEARRQRRQRWTSIRQVSERLKSSVIGPVWARVDKVLLDWGL